MKAATLALILAATAAFACLLLLLPANASSEWEQTPPAAERPSAEAQHVGEGVNQPLQ